MHPMVRKLATVLFFVTLGSTTQAVDCVEDQCWVVCVYDIQPVWYHDGKVFYSHNDCVQTIATSKCGWCTVGGGCEMYAMCMFATVTPNCYYKLNRCVCTEQEC